MDQLPHSEDYVLQFYALLELPGRYSSAVARNVVHFLQSSLSIITMFTIIVVFTNLQKKERKRNEKLHMHILKWNPIYIFLALHVTTMPMLTCDYSEVPGF